MSALNDPITADPVTTARELAVEFAREAADRDRLRRFPHAEMEMLRASGLTRLRVPVEFGGLGASASTLCRVLSALGEGDPNIAQMYYIHSYGVLNASALPAEGKERIYRRVVEENALITNAFSEVTTQNCAQFNMRLTPQDDGGWLYNGRKFYCTGSLAGQVLFSIGVTEGEPQDIRVSFIPTDAPGVTIHDDWSGLGQRTTSSGSTEFSDVRVDPALSFSAIPLATRESNWGSLGQCMFAAIWVGVARAALKDSVEYVRTKSRPWGTSGVERAVDDPYKVADIGEMAIAVTTAEAILERACRIRDEVEAAPPSLESRDRASISGAEANVVCGRLALMIAERLFKVCGTGAVLEQYGYDRHWRNVRTMTLHDPVDYKVRLVGDFVLNGSSPPISNYS